MEKRNFKVIIVGGGVAGLTLANILERFGIEFIVLEAGLDPAPQEGASIGLMGHGLRILDQLGCYEKLRVPNSKMLDLLVLRSKDTVVGTYHGFSSLFEKRHGYGILLRDRHVLLRVLYDNLQHKSNILLGKKVTGVATIGACVQVQTRDGSIFNGDIVVGADGIHSIVRQEMRRIASELSPEYFPADELSRVPIRYRSLFGISRATSSIPTSLFAPIWNKDRSALIIGNPSGCVTWFFFERLAEPTSQDKCPRYTEKDALAMVEKYRNDKITEEVTLGDLYDTKIESGITPLAEWVFEKWHFGRIITIGDSAHKTHPLLGQGGNGAIETAAALVNALNRKFESNSGPLSDSDIEAVFHETQVVREERARLFVDKSREDQQVAAMETPLYQFLGGVMPALMSRDMRDAANTTIIEGAVKIERLPVPKTRHALPFPDELPAKPLRSAWLPRTITALSLIGLFYLANNAIDLDLAPPDLFRGSPFKRTYTGLAAIDETILILVQCFTPEVAGEDEAQRVQAIYFLPMISSVILIWMVEAHRRGNRQTLIGRILLWPAVFAVFYQLYTIAKVGPIYYLITLFTSNDPIYQRTTGRNVDPAVARALLPALFLGYAIPTFLMFTPFYNHTIWQSCIAMWQFSPIITPPLTSFIASLIRRGGPRQGPDPCELRELENTDVPHLRVAYSAVFCANFAVHIGTLFYAINSPTISLWRAFFDVPNPFNRQADLAGNEKIFNLFKYDLIFYALVLLVWCLYSVFEMRRLGYVRTRQALIAAVGMPVSLVILGPGAMYAGVWHWRENVISGLSKL